MTRDRPARGSCRESTLADERTWVVAVLPPGSCQAAGGGGGRARLVLAVPAAWLKPGGRWRRGEAPSPGFSQGRALWLRGREQCARRALRGAALVQVPRQPAAEEREARAEDQARVDLARRRDDSLVENVARLVGERVEERRVELVDRLARVARDDDVHLSVREVLERRREREAIGECVVQRVEDVVRDPRADHREQRRRRHRNTDPQRRLVGLLERVAVLERLHENARLAREQAVDDERGSVLDEHATLAELRRHVPRGGERRVVGRRRANDLDEGEHGDRVEEVHARRPARGGGDERPSRRPRGTRCW